MIAKWLFTKQNVRLRSGRAVAKAVGRWLPTVAARVRVRTEHVGFMVDKAALEQVFSEYFGFPCQSSFHQFLHHHNHPGLAQWAYWWPQCRVDPIGLHPPPATIPIKKIRLVVWLMVGCSGGLVTQHLPGYRVTKSC
jgi:hypothetical protein